MQSVPLRFVRIRLLQVGRELRSAGVFRGGVLIILFFVSLFVFGFSQLQFPAAWVGGAVLVLAVFSIQRLRFDRSIVAVATPVIWKVFFMEYLFFSSPFLLSGIILGSPVPLVLIPVLFLISLVPGKKNISRGPGRLSRMIPVTAFEWRAGFRKSGYMVAVLYLLAVGLSPLPYATLVLLWLLTASLASFYLESEGREMVEAFKSGPGLFIRKKLMLNLKLAIVLMAIPLILHAVFQSREWIALLIFTFMMLLNVALFVVSKYAVWRPGVSGSVNEMIFSLAIISIIIPFLIPLPLFFLIRNTIRSNKNLTPWLHDFNS